MSGQINRGTDTGEFIYNLCLDNSILDIVEIGTWNGRGSTKCIADAILQRYDNSRLITIEANEKMFNAAKEYWNNILLSYNSFMKDKITLLHGRIIEKTNLIPIEEIRTYSNYIIDWERWYSEDVLSMDTCENILHSIPESIDLLLLDGGEFSTISEFNILKNRSKYILCDDTNTTKCSLISKQMQQDDKYELIFNNQNDGRNGFMAFRKKNE